LDNRRLEHGRSFGAAVKEYERGRPPYPTESIDWMLPVGARRVLDLGAGTGKLTRQLVGRGLEVVAVEPLDGMRELLVRAVPTAEVHPGTAEAIPLADGSVDAVLVAQAWHWVEPELAVPEVARVLRPGGRLGLIWNTRNEDVGWVAELGRILAHSHVGDGDLGQASMPVVGPPFTPLEESSVAWRHTTSREAVLDMVASRSQVIMLPEAGRSALLAEVHDLLESHPDLAGRDIVMPYLTRCFRAGLG
jgi:SAM-dependent methyltransferase